MIKCQNFNLSLKDWNVSFMYFWLFVSAVSRNCSTPVNNVVWNEFIIKSVTRREECSGYAFLQ